MLCCGRPLPSYADIVSEGEGVRSPSSWRQEQLGTPTIFTYHHCRSR